MAKRKHACPRVREKRYRIQEKEDERVLEWLGSSEKDFDRMPLDVQHAFMLHLAEVLRGEFDVRYQKPMKGFDIQVLEIIHRRVFDTYRLVYTVKYRPIIYILHVFQKKSPRNSETSRVDIDLIRSRIKMIKER